MGFDAAAGVPLRLVDAVPVAEVAHLHSEVAAGDDPLVRLGGYGVPGHVPPREAAVVAVGFRVGPLAEDCEGDTTLVQMGKFGTCPVKKVQPSHWSAAVWPSCHM